MLGASAAVPEHIKSRVLLPKAKLPVSNSEPAVTVLENLALVPFSRPVIVPPERGNAPRFANASTGDEAPVPPLAVEIGPERARVTFPAEPPPVRPGPAVTAVMLLEIPPPPEPVPTLGKV